MYSEKQRAEKKKQNRSKLVAKITDLENISAAMLPLPISSNAYPNAFRNLNIVNTNLKKAYCALESFDAAVLAAQKTRRTTSGGKRWWAVWD